MSLYRDKCQRIEGDTERRFNVLDERGLGITPRETDIDDKRNPAVVQDGLREKG